MFDTAAFADLRSYIKRRVSYVRYKMGGIYYEANLNDVDILADGTVRVRVTLAPTITQNVTVTRVELYSSANELWAHQDVSIQLTPASSRALFWFDFKIEEVN